MEHVIEVFVADHCPGSPEARLRVREFAKDRRDVVVIERRVEHEVETARRYGLIATPAFVIDGHALFYGVPSITQLAARCSRAAG